MVEGDITDEDITIRGDTHPVGTDRLMEDAVAACKIS